MEGVEAWSLYPKSAKQVISYMGATGWYSRFIPIYGTISAPIFNPIKGAKSLRFPEGANEAFNKWKMSLTTNLVLTYPDFEKYFYERCFRCGSGNSAVPKGRWELRTSYCVLFLQSHIDAAQLLCQREGMLRCGSCHQKIPDCCSIGTPYIIDGLFLLVFYT